MTKVSVIGSISMDLVTRTNRVPNAGETVFGEDFAMVPGGKGANQAVAFARLSPNEVSMIGAVGKDAFGESILQNFKENAVLFENVGTVPQTTGIAQITLFDDDNRIIDHHPHPHNQTGERNGIDRQTDQLEKQYTDDHRNRYTDPDNHR